MSSLGPRQATTDYLRWLASHIPLVEEDLKAKAAAMAADPLRFLRGTYYLWLLRAPEEIPEALAAPRVVAVGDAHVENFGIWLDAGGRRVWGINDFDEVGLAPYTLDLLRTVTSAVVSSELGSGLRLGAEALGQLVLEGWAQGVQDPSAFLLDGADHAHLSALAPSVEPKRFWKHLQSAPTPDEVPGTPAALVAEEGLRQPEWRRRVAGTGSLGHRRLAAIGLLQGSRAAFEAKDLGPPTVEWPPLRETTRQWRGSSARAWEAVSRMPGFPPGSRRREGWAVRRLGPESGRIELATLGRRRDESALVRSMGRALGAVHAAGGVGLDDALAHAGRWPARDLAEAAEAMAARVRQDFHHWD